MEARLEAIPSTVALWWQKLGKWQTMMVVATLAAFFVTWGVTGDIRDAAFVAGLAVIAVTAATAFAFAGEVPSVGKKAIWASSI